MLARVTEDGRMQVPPGTIVFFCIPLKSRESAWIGLLEEKKIVYHDTGQMGNRPDVIR